MTVESGTLDDFLAIHSDTLERQNRAHDLPAAGGAGAIRPPPPATSADPDRARLRRAGVWPAVTSCTTAARRTI
jgi:hypothetical protein